MQIIDLSPDRTVALCFILRPILQIGAAEAAPSHFVKKEHNICK